VEVEGVGMGCILMKTEIFKKLQKPYFEFIYNKKSDDWMGEDFNLLSKPYLGLIRCFIDK
jgi:hypothetical protein